MCILVTKLCPTLCDPITHHALLSMEFSRQEHYHSLLHGPGDLLDAGIKPGSPTLQEEFVPSELPGKSLG